MLPVRSQHVGDDDGLLSTHKEVALHEGIQLLNGKKKMFSGNLEALALGN